VEVLLWGTALNVSVLLTRDTRPLYAATVEIGFCHLLMNVIKRRYACYLQTDRKCLLRYEMFHREVVVKVWSARPAHVL
jgi:hypothetical protein